MRKDLLTNLKELKRIEPDNNYAQQSKMFILAHAQNEIRPRSEFYVLVRLSTIVAVMAFAVFSLLRGVFYINTTYSPLALDGLNQNSLNSEATQINKSIESTLNEINRLDRSNKTSASKMSELSKSSSFSVLSVTTTPDVATSTVIENINSYLIQSPTSTPVMNNGNDIDILLEKAVK